MRYSVMWKQLKKAAAYSCTSYDAAVKTKDHHRPDVVYWDQVEGTEFYHDLKIAWRLGTKVAPPQDAGINAARGWKPAVKTATKGVKREKKPEPRDLARRQRSSTRSRLQSEELMGQRWANYSDGCRSCRRGKRLARSCMDGTQ